MPSKSQKLRGYPIPDIIEPAGTRCIAFQIPDDDGYHRAMIAQATLLGKWWNWKRTTPETMEAKLASEHFSTVLKYSSLDETIPCEVLDSEGGVIVTTVEELTQAMCEGILCALPKVGATMSAGLNSSISDNLTIDENGNIIVDDGTSGGLSPTETLEAKTGAVYEIWKGLNEYITDFETWYQNYNADVATWQLFAESKYLVDSTTIAQAISDYQAWRGVSGTGLNLLPESMTSYLYCKGTSKSKINIFVIDEAGEPVPVLEIFTPILQDQIDQWYQDGLARLRDEYKTFSCIIRQDNGLSYGGSNIGSYYNPSITDWNFSTSDSRLIRVSLTGKLVSASDSSYWRDAHYYAVGGNPIQDYLQYEPRLIGSAGEVVLKPDSIIQYDGSNKYSWIQEIPSANYTSVGIWYRNINDGNIPGIDPTAIGTIDLLMEDLGEA